MRPIAEPTRASVGVAATAWFVTLVAAALGAQIVIAVSGNGGESLVDLPFRFTAMALVAQWGSAVAVLWFVSVRYLTGHPMADYALRFKWLDAVGIPLGVLSQLVLLELIYWPLRALFEDTFSRVELEKPARELTDRASGGWKVVLVVAVVMCAPIIEETMYRGLILRSLDARIADVLALLISAVWFAAVHIQGLQFLGLFAFGLVLGSCVQRTGRLGMAILTHAAFNATSLVLLW